MKNMSRHKTRRVIYVLVAILSAVVLVCCILTAVSDYAEYNRGVKLYTSLRSELLLEPRPDNDTPEAIDGIDVDYYGGVEYLKELYPDTYGYIVIDGTDVSYPIMRASNNDFYLNRAYTGEYSPVGSVFADYRSEDDPGNNANTVLYAHNLMYGGMFHALEEMYLDGELFERALVRLYTSDCEYVYKPVSVYETVSDGDYFETEFADDGEIAEFKETVISRSVHSADIPDIDGVMLTLSTCTNRLQSGRYALHAILIDREKLNELS